MSALDCCRPRRAARRPRLAALACAVGVTALPAAARAEAVDASTAAAPACPLRSSGYYVQAELNPSIFAQSDDADAPGVFFRTLGVAARAGRRWGDLAVFGSLETNFW